MNEKEALIELNRLKSISPQFKCPFSQRVCIKECWAFSEAFLSKNVEVDSFKIISSCCRFAKIVEACSLFIIKNKLDEISLSKLINNKPSATEVVKEMENKNESK